MNSASEKFDALMITVVGWERIPQKARFCLWRGDRRNDIAL